MTKGLFHNAHWIAPADDIPPEDQIRHYYAEAARLEGVYHERVLAGHRSDAETQELAYHIATAELYIRAVINTNPHLDASIAPKHAHEWDHDARWFDDETGEILDAYQRRPSDEGAGQ